MFLAKLDFSRWTKDISFVRLPCLSAEILLDQGARRCSFMEFTWAYIQLKHPQTLEIHTQSSTLSPPVLHTQSITLSPPHSILRIFRPTIPSKQKPGFTMSRCPYCQYNNMAPAQKSVLFNKCSKCKKTFARNLPMQRHTYTVSFLFLWPLLPIQLLTLPSPGGLEEMAPRSRRDPAGLPRQMSPQSIPRQTTAQSMPRQKTTRSMVPKSDGWVRSMLQSIASSRTSKHGLVVESAWMRGEDERSGWYRFGSSWVPICTA
ncbi:hypothetical protein DL95DRAFT_32449 [Leptodontidium sp. 2 PMI_412]|nr:hypothetical protein DL95DRAFT_32449 [Leptodontidium sp. 2 PMI_412]